MLSRAAEQMFWMGRYVERACNLARFLDVNYDLSLDWEPRYVQWEPLVHITGDFNYYMERSGRFDATSVMRFLLLDTEYQNSAFSALTMARENARTSRECLPLEFWEELNRTYQLMNKYVTQKSLTPATLQRLCGRITSSGIHLQGICQDTMWHGEGYQFYKLGVWLERADKTSRLLHAKYFYLLPNASDVGSPLDDLHWAALLHFASGLDIYHRQHGLVTPNSVISFLVLDERFPRSILFCLQHAAQCLHAIVSPVGIEGTNPNQRSVEAMTNLRAYVEGRRGEEIIINGLHEFVNDFQVKLNQASEEVQLDFF